MYDYGVTRWDEIEMTNFWVTLQRLTSTILGGWNH